MKTGIKILVLVVLSCTSIVCATDITFTSSETIQENNVYNAVYIYDTPPNQTIINMTGGEVGSVGLNNSSVFNLYDGILWNLSTFDNTTVNLYGGSILYGFQGWSETSTINIYGYDFMTTIQNQRIYLSGKWQDSSVFNFYFFRAFELPANVILHTIPEPATILLVTVGGVGLKKA